MRKAAHTDPVGDEGQAVVPVLVHGRRVLESDARPAEPEADLFAFTPDPR